ncbi:MAG TPA: response regulator [Parasegetibacter sp.]
MKRRKISVLIVDDNSNFIKRMIGIIVELENINFVHTASNYEEALNMLRREHHDLVLLDINLPSKSGIKLLEAIREASWNCKVVMLSNYSGDSYRQHCTGLGANYFLDKTIDFELVPDILNSIHPN